MTKKKPLDDAPGLDLTKLDLEERVARLEGLIETVANHQMNLGASLIRAHQNLIQISKDILATNVPPGALREELPVNDGSIVRHTAPLILPGPHPLRPTPRRDF